MDRQLAYILNLLMSGDLKDALSLQNIIYVSQATQYLLSIQRPLYQNEIDDLSTIISISNIVYNNTTRAVLFLDDGMYDLALELLKKYSNSFPVGAPPVQFKDGDVNSQTNAIKKPVQLEDPLITVDSNFIEKSLYFGDIFTPRPQFDYVFFNRVENRDADVKAPKRKVNIPHKYPSLVGTLDKCKFVTNKQARDAGAFNDPKVKIFERDFLGKQLEEGIFDVNTPLTLIAELKYDGMSIEADVTDHIISARSRGDTNNDLAADYTHVLGGMRFPFCPDIDDSEAFGMKFEAIMTHADLDRYARLRGRTYANCRNAIAGLLDSTDAYNYRDLITLVPLKTSLNIDPIQEIGFMNQYYQSGELLRYAILTGTYYQILFEVMKFVEEAEFIRPAMPFMYDGVVIHHTDPGIIARLGRENSIDKWSMAIKFNPLQAKAIFTGYTFTVGQNGVVTPMIHFTPVEFFGAIHDHASGHSFERFKNLNLAIGDVLDIKYTNDVMPYVTKSEDNDNLVNPNPPELFPANCPSCGAPLVMSESGKSLNCPNPNCYEKCISKMSNMMKKLNLKDFGEASMQALGITNLNQFMNITLEQAKVLGEVNGAKLMDNIYYLHDIPIEDYRMVGSIGFEDVAIETWRRILSEVSLGSVIYNPDEVLYQQLIAIDGIGPKTALTITNQRHFLMDDLMYINSMPNVVHSYGDRRSRKKIRITGFRDKDLINRLNLMGYDASDGGVTKDTFILVIPSESFQSSKTDKADKYGVPKWTLSKLMSSMDLLEKGV